MSKNLFHRKIGLPICSSLMLVLASFNAAGEAARASNTIVETVLTPFNVSYQTELMGTKLTADSKLEQLKSGQYQYQYNTSSMLGKATEVSRFMVEGSNRILPHSYRYRLSALGIKKRISLAFDWQAEQVTDRAAKPQWTLDLPNGALDPLSMQLQLRADMMNGGSDPAYQVPRHGRLKLYQFMIEGEEIIETAVGPLKTVRVSRNRGDDSTKFTTIWLAVDWSYIMVKIRDGRVDGRDQEAVLTGGSIGGIRIKGLNR